jgi:hypothetical protein
VRSWEHGYIRVRLVITLLFCDLSGQQYFYFCKHEFTRSIKTHAELISLYNFNNGFMEVCVFNTYFLVAFLCERVISNNLLTFKV